MSLVVNGVRADFITSSRLLSLNKHLPVTSVTGPGAERSGQTGPRQIGRELDRQQSRLTIKYLPIKVGSVSHSSFQCCLCDSGGIAG